MFSINFLNFFNMYKRKVELVKFECEVQVFFIDEKILFLKVQECGKFCILFLECIYLQNLERSLFCWQNRVDSLFKSFLGIFFNRVIVIKDFCERRVSR